MLLQMAQELVSIEKPQFQHYLASKTSEDNEW